MQGWGQSADPRLQIQIAARGGEGSCRAGRRVCRSQIAAADLAGICRVKSAGSHLSCSKSSDSLSADCRFFFSSAITDGICKVPYMHPSPAWMRPRPFSSPPRPTDRLLILALRPSLSGWVVLLATRRACCSRCSKSMRCVAPLAKAETRRACAECGCTRSFLTGRRLASSMAWPCDPQAFSQQQSPIRRMELHVAVDFAATHGLGDCLQNWTNCP